MVDGFLDRIRRLEPGLNSFRSVYVERALAEADQADARLRAGEERPLLGVPVAVKDNMDVAGDVTGYGTREWRGPAKADSEGGRRAPAAGALGSRQTHLPALAIRPVTQSATRGTTP